MAKSSPSKAKAPDSEPSPAVTPTPAAGGLVRVYNRQGNTFTHGEHVLPPHGSIEVPEEVAAIWEGHNYAGHAAVIREAPSSGAAAKDAVIAQKDAALAEKDKQLENLEKMLAELQAKVAAQPPPTS